MSVKMLDYLTGATEKRYYPAVKNSVHPMNQSLQATQHGLMVYFL